MLSVHFLSSSLVKHLCNHSCTLSFSFSFFSGCSPVSLLELELELVCLPFSPPVRASYCRRCCSAALLFPPQFPDCFPEACSPVLPAAIPMGQTYLFTHTRTHTHTHTHTHTQPTLTQYH